MRHLMTYPLPKTSTYTCSAFFVATASTHRGALAPRGLLRRNRRVAARVVQPWRRRRVGAESRGKQRQREEDLRPLFEQREQLRIHIAIADRMQEAVDSRSQEILGVGQRRDVGEH